MSTNKYTGILSSLVGVQLGNFIISPHNRHYRAWETCLAVLVLYTAWVSPFEFGFLEKPERLLSFIDNIVNGFFAIDIVLTFFIAYLDKSTNLLVENQKKIAWRYTSTWLIFDVVSTIPSELAGNLSIGYLQSYELINMFRLWRLHRVNALFSRLEKNKNFNYFWVRLTKLIFVTLFATHCAGCFYYRLAANYHDPGRTWIGYGNRHFKEQSLRVRYVTSMYWSASTLVGDGALDAQNTREMIFFICYVLFNLGLTTYLIGNMTTLVVRDTSTTTEYRDMIQAKSMPASGRMDRSLRLFFATQRGDDLLLHQLLKRGLDPNKADNNGRNALHIAASRGSENCVHLLLDFGADPNSTDSEGNVPLWEAILGNHETVVGLLKDNGATLSSSDVGRFSCIAAEQNNLYLLKQIIIHGGEVTRAKNDGSTSLHVAVSKFNFEMVKFLLDQGANIDQQDHYGCTPEPWRTNKAMKI